MGEDAAGRLKEMFSEFDYDKTHTISRATLGKVFRQLSPNFTQAMVDALMDSVDKNNDGIIQYNEFVDFLFSLGGAEPDEAEMNIRLSPNTRKLSRAKSKLFDITRWKRVASGAGAWGFLVDQEASAIRKLVRSFPELAERSPEGLTLAEEFVLVWQDEKGNLDNYSYFGEDEQFHNALFGACLLGLRARNLLEFREVKNPWLGTGFKLKLYGEPPRDSEVLYKVYCELEDQPDMTLKEWFGEKSGKWGQDTTTKMVINSLIKQGVLCEGKIGEAYSDSKFKLLDKDRKARIMTRLRQVVKGDVEPDSRSVALLALCRTADMRDTSDHTLMNNIFGENNAVEMMKKLEALVESVMHFEGIGVDDLNSMIDALPAHAQEHLCSDEFWTGATQSYRKYRGADRDAVPIEDMLDQAMAQHWEVVSFLEATKDGMKEVVQMFDGNDDGYVSEQEYVGFEMWCGAMKMMSID